MFEMLGTHLAYVYIREDFPNFKKKNGTEIRYIMKRLLINYYICILFKNK